MVHALALALVVLLAAPLASHVPLAVLAGVLLFVAWNMGEWREFARLRQFSPHYRLLLLSTFLVTVVFDLTLAVELGLMLACLLFVRRQGSLFSAELVSRSERLLRYELYGSLFFGAVTKIDPILAEIEAGPDRLDVSLDATRLVALDTTGLDALEQLVETLERKGRPARHPAPQRAAALAAGALGTGRAPARLQLKPPSIPGLPTRSCAGWVESADLPLDRY